MHKYKEEIKVWKIKKKTVKIDAKKLWNIKLKK